MKTVCSQIVGTGSFLPQRVVENAEIGWQVQREPDEIFRVTGIRTRRWVVPGEECSMLAEGAARKALESSGLPAENLDAIIVSTTSPDTIFPATGCALQRRLGIGTIPAFDISASCSGFLYGLSMADSFIRSEQYSCILVVAAEVKSRYLDSRDGDSRMLFGDGAGAAVLVRESQPSDPPHGILGLHLYADGGYHNLVQIPAGGSRLPTTLETVRDRLHGIELDGGILFRTAVKRLSFAVEELLREFHLEVKDLKQIIAHQANGRIINAIAKRLKIPEDKMVSIIEEYGNTSSASLPIALDFASRGGAFGKGDLIVLGAFGGGLTWGTALIRW